MYAVGTEFLTKTRSHHQMRKQYEIDASFIKFKGDKPDLTKTDSNVAGQILLH